MRTLIAVLALVVVGGLAVFGLSRWLESPTAAPAAMGETLASGDAAPATDPGRVTPLDSEGTSSAAANELARRSTAATPEVAQDSVLNAEEPGFLGRIVDEQGRPVAEAAVRLVSEEGAGTRGTTETGSDGRFELDAPQDLGRARLAIRARGFLELDRDVAAPQGHRVDLEDIAIVRGVVISGRVLDPSGLGIAGAQVHLIRDEGNELGALGFDFGEMQTRFGTGAGTDADGHFEFLHEPAGAFELRAVHARYPIARLEGEAEAPGDDQIGLELRLEAGASIRGRVTGIPADGQDSIEVTASSSSSTEGLTSGLTVNLGDMLEEVGLGVGERVVAIEDDGSFVLEGLEPEGRYRIWAVTAGAERYERKSCSAPVDARAGDHGVQVVYDAGESIVFDVVDARSGEPIEELAIDHQWALDAGWIIQRAAPETATVTYPDGHVEIDSLRPPNGNRQLKLSIDAIGFERLRQTVDVRSGAGPFELGALTLQPVPLVRVAVVDDSSGRPIGGARVSLSTTTGSEEEAESDGSLTVRREITFSSSDDEGGPPAAQGESRQVYRGITAADGTCVLSSMPGRTATLRVTADDLAPFETELELPPTKDYAIDVRLLAGGIVELQVVDARGRALADVEVEHRAGSQSGSRTRDRSTDGSGRIDFESLAPGTHSFRVASNANGGGIRITTGTETEAWTEVEIANGERAMLELVEPLRGSLAGTVTENGAPLDKATVSLIREPEFDDENPEQQALEQALSNELGGLMALAGPRTRTDEEGRFELEGVEVGRYTLRVEHTDRAMPQTSSVEVREGPNEEDVTLVAAVIRGRVVTSDGEPIRRARVSAERPSAMTLPPELGDEADLALVRGFAAQLGGGNRSVTTDSDGWFELRGVTPGVELIVSATARGHVDGNSEPLTVAADETRALDDLVLIEAGRLRVEVESPSGAPLPSSASAHWAGDPGQVQDPEAMLLRRGRALFRNLRPGPWRIRTGDREELVEVTPGGTAEVFVSF